MHLQLRHSHFVLQKSIGTSQGRCIFQMIRIGSLQDFYEIVRTREECESSVLTERHRFCLA